MTRKIKLTFIIVFCGIVSTILFIAVNECRWQCNCPTESICTKPCKSFLSIFNIKSCSFDLGTVFPQNARPVDGSKKIDDWQTCANEEYRFEFQYPNDLEKKENQYYLFDLVNEQVGIHIDILNEKFDIDNVKSLIGYIPKDDINETTINGVRAYYFSDGDMGFGGNSYRMPLGEKHMLFIWFVTEGGFYQDEDKIISSIKILDN